MVDTVPMPQAPQQDRWLSAVLLAVSAVALGHALQISNGNQHPDALFWLTVSGLCCLGGVVLPTRAPVERVGAWAVIGLLGAGLAFQFSELLVAPPGMYIHYGPGWHVTFYRGLVIAAVLAGGFVPDSRWLKHVQVPVLLVTHLVLGFWLIKASPAPFIDVYVFQRDSSAALLHGSNPYAITFPDIYGNSVFYGPGLSVNGRLTFGFPYPPLSLLLAVVGHVFGGDHRYSQLFAMAGAAALMAYARPGRLGALAAAVYLFTPRVFFVLEQAWTEPYIVLLLAAVVFCACRRPRALPYVFGLFIAVKQYLVLAVPLSLLLLPRPWSVRATWDFLWRAGAVALAVSLPLIVINVPAFFHSAVELQFHQPFRPDALSYLVKMAQEGEPPPTGSGSLLAAFLLGALALWRAPRTPSGFAAAVALVFIGFFAFNKQAFCNYYFFVVGALCVAIAATAKPSEA